jgi:hypothetical protein
MRASISALLAVRWPVGSVACKLGKASKGDPAGVLASGLLNLERQGLVASDHVNSNGEYRRLVSKRQDSSSFLLSVLGSCFLRRRLVPCVEREDGKPKAHGPRSLAR